MRSKDRVDGIVVKIFADEAKEIVLLSYKSNSKLRN